MTDKTLFLSWQDATSRRWFPVGRLDAAMGESPYRFRYIRGASAAHEASNFQPLWDFPDLNKAYESVDLFPLFKNRLYAASRPDFRDYLRQLDLPIDASPLEILAVDGGHRVTDAFEVFPKLKRLANGTFRCRFFVHGSRYIPVHSQQKLQSLRPGERLHVSIELTNPTGELALQLHTEDYFMLGWMPRYLVADLARAIAGASRHYKATVVRVNPVPAPSQQRLLVELEGEWPDFEPMSQGLFEPLVPLARLMPN